MKNKRLYIITALLTALGAVVFYLFGVESNAIFSGMLLVGIVLVVVNVLNKGNKQSMALEAVGVSPEDVGGISLSEIGGNIEAKESVEDIIDFLKEPERYRKYGARLPKGIIFYGPPGTGKTLMAKAVAGEADVPFYCVSGSDFVQMYVGVGALRIRELFKKARENKRALIFIDEIDALGKKRGNSATGSNDEREQTLNALLTEMSGFGDDEGIVVIAATNRLDTLDSALLRAGRFDRQIEIGLPDVNARERILKMHCKNKPIAKDVDIKEIAVKTVFFSGAMLESLLNESAIGAVRESKEYIDSDDIDRAYYTVLAGSEKKERDCIRQRDKEITAYHEAGHAVAMRILKPESKLHRVSIIPTTKGAGGYCLNTGEDKLYHTKRELETEVMVSYAGRCAEEIIFGSENVTTGAVNDIEKATEIIKDLVTKYGMSNNMGIVNTVVLGENGTSEEIREYSQRLYQEAKNTINENIDKVSKIGLLLLEKESVSGEEIAKIV